MKKRPFAATGVEVPIIGQGTWAIERGDRGEARRALRRGLELGANHIDTAEMYGNGAAEELVAEAIAGKRDEAFLVSKVLPSNASRAGTVAACENSLRRLGTDHLDCYLLHWEGDHPLEETVAGFEQLVGDGKIRSWGVSNFDERALAHAIAGAERIACNQVCYHVQERAIEHEVIPYCQDKSIAVVAYSPFGSGGFPGRRSGGGKVLADIAGTRRATPYQVVLAFLCRHEGLFAIPKSSSVAHAVDNAAAGDLVLEDRELERLETAFPLGPRGRGLPMI